MLISTLHQYTITFLFLFFFNSTNAQNDVTPGDIRIDATFENISIHYSITGDENLNSTLNIKYRVQGSSNYKNGAITRRAHPNMVTDGEFFSMNFHAGSALYLLPNTTYELQLILEDSDGGSITSENTATTKSFPVPSMNNIRYVSPGLSGGNGTQSNPYRGLQTAANNAQPGDHFIVAPGSYTAFELTTSGTIDANISFISQELHGAIIDGKNTTGGIITLGEFFDSIAYINQLNHLTP